MSGFALTDQQLRAELSRQCDMAGGQAEWARRHGVVRSQVCQAISGSREVPDSIVNAMGLLRVTRYVPAKLGANHMIGSAA